MTAATITGSEGVLWRPSASLRVAPGLRSQNRLAATVLAAITALALLFAAAPNASTIDLFGTEIGVAAQTGPAQAFVGAETSVRPAFVGPNSVYAYDGMSGCCVAPNSTRGLSPLGGVIEQTGTNSAGGRIFTSTGPISQNDFAGIVQSGVARGDDVHIFTGAHGLPNGSLVTDATLLADDVRAFGRLPGVQVHDLPSMSAAQVREILESPGTIIGGFCDSGACLAPFSG